jgi:glycosyltransferase involved in cell wall biosynthesis
LRELGSLRDLRRIYLREAPDLIHHVTVKPNTYGTIVARWSGRPVVVNSFMGLGSLFDPTLRSRVLRTCVAAGWKAFRGKAEWTIAETRQDLAVLINLGFADPTRSSVIPGDVDLARFTPARAAQNEPLRVLMACRLLRGKGVEDFVKAAELLRASSHEVAFAVAGTTDRGNPTAIPESQIALWQEGPVDFLGHVEDMADLLRHSSVAVLPTFYQEGIPRFLLEAAAAGLPIVATDVGGCSEVVREGLNGFLVRPRTPEALAGAISRLLDDPGLRAEMGRAGRLVAQSFDQREVVAAHIALCAEVAGLDELRR